MEVESQNYQPHVYTLVLEVLFKPKIGLSTDDKAVEESKKKLSKVLDVYEERLSKSKYLAGNFYSLADLTHLSYTHYVVNEIGLGYMFKDRKHVSAWWEDISSRPSWQKVLEL